jgi:hypothetical protein
MATDGVEARLTLRHLGLHERGVFLRRRKRSAANYSRGKTEQTHKRRQVVISGGVERCVSAKVNGYSQQSTQCLLPDATSPTLRSEEQRCRSFPDLRFTQAGH